MNLVPFPCSLSTWTVPWWALTIQATKLRPSPKPFSGEAGLGLLTR